MMRVFDDYKKEEFITFREAIESKIHKTFQVFQPVRYI